MAQSVTVAAAPVGLPFAPTKMHYTARPTFPADLQVLVICSPGSKADVAKSLSTSGRKAVMCTGFHEALSALSTCSYDVVLAEMSMALAQDTGAAQLKAYGLAVPIVLFNSSVTSKETWAAISYGAADIVSFPFARQQMQTLWKHTVKQHGPAPRPFVSGCAAAAQQPFVTAPVTKDVGKLDVKASPLPSQPESKKRKIKDVSSAVVPGRPSVSVKPAIMGLAMSAPQQAPQMVRYLTPANMPAPHVMPNAHLSWGHPVMGMPAAVRHHPQVSFVPGHPQAWAHPQFAAMRHPHMMPTMAPAASSPVVFAHPVMPGAPVQFPSQPCPAIEAAPAVKVTKLLPSSPDTKSEDSASASSQSDTSNFASLRAAVSEEDLVTIPDAGCSATSSVCHDTIDLQPTALDDIGDDEYAFIDFALSDDFPTYDEDELAPPLGLTLKKSSSLVNMLNVQMPVF
mmetsp:Transcript_30733/g.86874  ORF Transcript_30733/g.86874 Transcript_30733/m.86874 type:complete len:454 (+) Transcript_30733:353-1714(+)|eukprot:CAMPEP_0117658954 /NCGR_PEP_ID=MMETSP0804-20121206/6157_1 /TAXON_ID=1074897 /ORGANISM="Tetraselmis astigmatica, Strain CCMP880" /LENGTH=453 /DNA_ID=CAMNT_0005465545 /DNA_START=325 /DNA_END=1686 /DNA_ORIENTATION=+